MFGLLSMMGNYQERAVARFEAEGGDLIVDTCAVTDSSRPFETGVKHPRYNDGAWVIVELYDTREEAQAGHQRWVETMTRPELPPSLLDVSTAEIAELRGAFGEDWRRVPLQTEQSDKV